MQLSHSEKVSNKVFLFFAIILSAWLLVFYQGITTAIEIWSISEIFTHCFVVLPCAFYFIYNKRSLIFSENIQPEFWLLPFFIGSLFLQTFADVGEIKLFMHMATFGSLPLLIWMIIGRRAATHITFPLCFMLFSIPVGEQLIPVLQELTTDLAVPLLELTNVPVYRNGLYLDIPEGRFLVAEACSGISFLIASIVFGCLYAYVSFSTFSKQMIFVGLSIFIPIVANALRVYGIILTGHLSDMQYAVGADHLIYGGVFYGIIIFILMIIGEQFRDKQPKEDKNLKQVEAKLSIIKLDKSKNYTKLMIVLLSLFFMQLLWINSIFSSKGKIDDTRITVNLDTLNLVYQNNENFDWQPRFNGASVISQGQIDNSENQTIDYFIPVYDKYVTVGKENRELISSLNSLYNSDRWTLLSKKSIHIDSLNSAIIISNIASPLGGNRTIAHWYQLEAMTFSSEVKMKLYQTFFTLLAKPKVNALMAFSIQGGSDKQEQLLVDFIRNNGKQLSHLIEVK